MLPTYNKPVLNHILKQSEIFPETGLLINKFISKHKLKDKLKTLKQIREATYQNVGDFRIKIAEEFLVPGLIRRITEKLDKRTGLWVKRSDES